MATLPPHLLHPKYRPDIDGLRALAVLSVVAFHAFPVWVKGGFVGVDVFFVISGYLISAIIFDNLERGTFSFAEFYARRIKRIFPGLLLVLVASYAFGWFALLAGEYQQLGKHIAAGAGFVSNIVFLNEADYFDNLAETKPLLHLWSLGIEEQFYIVWPLLLWLAWKRNYNLFTLSIIIALVSFYLNVKGVRRHAVETFYSPQTRFWELSCGSLLAWLTLYKKDVFSALNGKLDGVLARAVYRDKPVLGGQALSNMLSIIGLFFLMYGFFSINKDLKFPGVWALIPVFGAVLIIAAGPKAWFNRAVLSNRLAVWFGLISFPLYLWHWPLLSYARIVEGEIPSENIRFVAVVVAILLAWCTYQFCERPVRLGQHGRKTVVALVLLMVIAGGVGYSTYQLAGLGFRAVVLKNAERDEDQAGSFKSNTYVPCVESLKHLDMSKWCGNYPAKGATKTIFLWGDSSTSAWLPVFLELAKERNYTVINISHQSCPPILNARKTTFRFAESIHYCADGKMQQEVLNLISRLKPDLVVLIAAWNSYSPYSNREFITDNDQGEADQASTEGVIRNGVPATLSALGRLGKVVVFKSWPFLPAVPNYTVKRIEALQSVHEKVYAKVSDFKKDSALINEVFSGINDANVSFYDPSSRICGDEHCDLVRGGKNLYSDTYHISPQGALQFKDDIARILN